MTNEFRLGFRSGLGCASHADAHNPSLNGIPVGTHSSCAIHYTVTALEKHDEVEAYVKSDHLGFQVHYIWQGSRR